MSEQSKTPYKVLARKYRPQNFDELIGQDALVRTLKNAIESGRIAHAYMLTGIRGTGKTTTARIIAKALNYTGPDGKAGPTVGSTDDCEICQAISADRHPDIMEMDAASRTGVDDIREITDGVRYAPVSARYKIYIIDEVHMLSKAAFNALLKTLEEPPPHVIFIFATTEIRKVPVTVLSRCQRFDLRRVDVPTLSSYYATICEKESVVAEDEALSMIAHAADGSVRDGLSLLDQVIALSNDKITADQVRDMLGLADRNKTFDLLAAVLSGEMEQALALVQDLYRNGVDPLVLVQDMMDYAHRLTRLRAVPQMKDDGGISGDIHDKLSALSAQISMPVLGRSWQILLKGLSEIQAAPNPYAATEMLLIRMGYAADLPDPADLLRRLKEQDNDQGSSSSAPYVPPQKTTPVRQPEPVAKITASGGSPSVALQPQTEIQQAESLETLDDVVALLHAHKEMILAGQVFHSVRLVKMKQGHLEISLEPEARPSLPQDLRKFLIAATDAQWMVSVSQAQGSATLAQKQTDLDAALMEDIKSHAVVKTVIEAFPGTEITVKRKSEQ